jgi:YVTN family beta-propeller protein
MRGSMTRRSAGQGSPTLLPNASRAATAVTVLVLVAALTISAATLAVSARAYAIGGTAPHSSPAAPGTLPAIAAGPAPKFNGLSDVAIASVPVGSSPTGIVFDPVNGYVYVTNSGSANVSVLNGTALVATIPVGSDPQQPAFDSGTGALFVPNTGSDNVSVVSGTSVVASVAVGSAPVTPTYDPADGYVYVSDSGGGAGDTVSVINATGVAATPTVGSSPGFSVYDPTDGDVYVTNAASASVSVLSGTSVTATVVVGYGPGDEAYDPSNGYVYVDNGGYLSGTTVSVVNGASTVATVPVGVGPAAATYDDSNAFVYVANYGSDNVSVLSGTSVVASLPVGSSPSASTYDPGDGDVYILNAASDNVSVLAGTSVLATVPVGSDPSAVAYDSDNGYLYVTNILSDNVSVIAPISNVTFTEVGIPAKQLADFGWSVAVSGSVQSSHSATITYNLTPGTYYFVVLGPAGYVAPDQPGGSFTAQGASFSYLENFEKGKGETLRFAARGLPVGQAWCAEVSGLSLCTTGRAVKFPPMTAFTYYYWIASPLAGQSITGKVGKTSVTLTGGTIQELALVRSTAVDLTFAYPYAVSFTESDLPSGGSWSVTIGKATETSAVGSPIVFELTNGSHAYRIGMVTGYRASGTPAKLVVRGADASVAVTFTPKP